MKEPQREPIDARKFMDELIDSDPKLRAEVERRQPWYQAVDVILDAQRRTGTTQQELAKRMGISLAALHRILLAESSPRLDSIARAAKAMGYRLDVRFVKERAPQYETPAATKTPKPKTRAAKPAPKATARKPHGSAA